MNFERFLIKARRHSVSSKHEKELLRGAVLSAILLQSEQLANGLWGRSIERYIRLHNAQSTLGRSVADTGLGSLTHSTHALRGLSAIGVRPIYVERLWRTLRDSCIQPDGHIYPLGSAGPVVTNLTEGTHTLAAARHSASGIVTYFHCRHLMGSMTKDALEIPRRSARLLARYAGSLTDWSPGYSHAYVLESLCYCKRAGLFSADLARLAVTMVKHLLGGEARQTGLWSSPQTQNLSNAYFSSIIAERLLWMLHSGIIKRRTKVSVQASDSIGLFLNRVSSEYTDRRSGGVYLDLERRITDYGTTARCAALALGLERRDMIANWWDFLTKSCPLTDSNAHTQTWEAALLLFSTIQGKRGSRRIRELLAQFHQNKSLAAGRLKKLIGITDRETVQGFKELWMSPATEKKAGVERTVVELDLEGFSDIARKLEEHFSARIVLQFEDQIQSFVDDGLKAVGVRREDAVMADTGDGAILVFERPPIAHAFAEAVHHSCSIHNRARTLSSARRRFRIGIATGDLAIDSRAARKMAGDVISRAVRLEAKASAGEIVIDTSTYAGLPRRIKVKYGLQELIHGKREERFPAHRCVVIPEIERQ